MSTERQQKKMKWDAVYTSIQSAIQSGALYTTANIEGDTNAPKSLRLSFWEPEKKNRGHIAIPWNMVNNASSTQTIVDREPCTFNYDILEAQAEQTWFELQITKKWRNVHEEYKVTLCDGFAGGRVKVTNKTISFKYTNGCLSWPLPSNNFIWYAGQNTWSKDTYANLIIVINGVLLVAPFALPCFNAGATIKNPGNIAKMFCDILKQKKNGQNTVLATGPHRRQIAGLITQVPNSIKKMNGINIRRLIEVAKALKEPKKTRGITKKHARAVFREEGARKIQFLLL